ncbi:MAG: FtsX-like permease family protein, partial [Solirubrobacteraceae bacterium]
MVLSSPTLPFDAFPLGEGPVVFYLEADWAQHPYGTEYTLLSGRMPRKPGQVVVSAGMFKHPLGRTVTAASGDVRLHIVGVIRDRFDTSDSAREVLAAAGTWASFDWTKLRRANFAAVTPEVEVLGDFRDWAQLAGIAIRYSAAQHIGDVSGTSLVFNRAMLAAYPMQSSVVAEPLVYKAPSLALAVLLPLLLLGLRARRTRRWSGTLRAIGVRPRTASLAVSGGTLALLVAAILVGVAGGEALGLLVRVLLAPRESQPLSPPASIVGQALRLAGVMVVVTVAVAAVAAEQQRGSSVRQLLARRPSGTVMAGLRWTLVAFAIAALVFIIPGSKPGSGGAAISVLVTVAVCLPLVDVFTLVRRLSAGRGLRLRLATSRLMMERFQCGAVCAAIVICVGPFIALSVNHAGYQQSQASSWDGWMPQGQVAIRAPNGAKFDRPDPRALQATEKLTGEKPIKISSLSTLNLDNPTSGEAVVGGGTQPALLAVDSVSALRRLLPGVLTAADVRIFAAGGVLHFEAAGPVPRRAPIRIVNQPRRERGSTRRPDTPMVNVASIPSDHAWEQQTSGFVLPSVARGWHLPVPIHVSQEAFTHITASMQNRIEKAIMSAGAPITSLSVRQPYQYLPEPSGLVFGRYAVLLLLLVTMAAALGSTARSLRKESRSLVAIGVRRS